MDAKSVGHTIAERRHGLGITQAELAETLGVTNKAVSRWECGAGLPDTALLEPLAKTLGIDVRMLVCENFRPPATPEEPAREDRPNVRWTAARIVLVIIIAVGLLYLAMLLAWEVVKPRG